MTDTAHTTHISQVGTVFVPVFDQDWALEFYLDKLGFEKRVDFSYGGSHRWIEVAPPGSTNAIALVPLTEGKSAGGDQTYCALATKDIEAGHATLRTRGVNVDAEIARKGTFRSGLSQSRLSLKIPCRRSFSSATLTGTVFWLLSWPDPG
jgi:hypothetical protein